MPGRGTVLLLNGESLLAPQPDAAVHAALLGVWLGDRPVDGRLKSALLAGLGTGTP